MSLPDGIGGGSPAPTSYERFKSHSRRRLWVSFFLSGAIHLGLLWWLPTVRPPSSQGRRVIEDTPAIRLITLLEKPATLIEESFSAPAEPAPPPAEEVVPVRRTMEEVSKRPAPTLAGIPAPPRIQPEQPAYPEDLFTERAGTAAPRPVPLEIPTPDPPAPPLPRAADPATSRYRRVTALMEKPVLVNRAQVERALLREYPRELQRAGVEGSVMVWFWIDEKGKITKYEIRGSSGRHELDAAAERVIPKMKFRPAREGGAAVPVIVIMPIRFEVK